jgi:DNA polymerase III delta subunit
MESMMIKKTSLFTSPEAEAPVEASEEFTEAAKVAEETPTMRAINRWVSAKVRSSPLSRNTEAYNYLMAQLPELASAIDKENQA